ncbi:unnamed protein product [Prorocentrum cordatum]|uniref:Peptidylprolyl isomerase n=1 Tax=Prorocentrum cordatum TaxID=2364126 RepID=A0ABN9VUS7_9DINO|nr:unnamed protein product [Polarella glacialis]
MYKLPSRLLACNCIFRLACAAATQDWRSGADIFGDGGAIRSTLQAGMGLHMPVQGSAVLCSLKVSTAGGEVLDDQDVMEYTLGSGELGPLSRTVDTVLQDMRTGGKVRLELSGQYAWGDGTYLVELGLKEVVQVEDISPAGDGSLRKKRVLRGRGDDPPRDCDLVTLTVEAATTHVPSGRGELSFRIGDGDVADGFELVAARMLPGCGVGDSGTRDDWGSVMTSSMLQDGKTMVGNGLWRAGYVRDCGTLLQEGGTQSEVLAGADTGSKPTPCLMLYIGDQAPRRTRLPDGAYNDKPETEPVTTATTALRMACAGVFCADDIFARAAQEPATLPAFFLKAEFAKDVIRTKGAINYDTAITTLLIANAGAEAIRM